MEFSVSVVVAVPRRPAGEQRFLLRRALESVQRQTLQPLEVVVVLDGPNASVCRELFKMDVPNLQIVMQEGETSKLNAWQTGISTARGRWVALLHDEDEWLPEKLAEQQQVAQNSSHKFPVVSCRLKMITETSEEIWPRRSPQPQESIGDYLFCRKSGFFGEGLLHRSTLLFPAALARAFPLRLPPVPQLPSEHDAQIEATHSGLMPSRGSQTKTPESIAQDDERSWLLRISKAAGVGFELLETTRCISRWNRLGLHPHPRNVVKTTWQASLAWIQRHRQHLSDKAYQTFILTEVAANAADAQDRRAFTQLLREACTVGLPTPRLLLIYLSLWLIKPKQRQRARHCINSHFSSNTASEMAAETMPEQEPNPPIDAPIPASSSVTALVPVTETPSLGGGALGQQVNGIA